MNDLASPQDLLDEASAAARLAKWDRACELLRQVAAVDDPALALEARLHLGLVLIFQGIPHHIKAEAVLQEALRQAERTLSPRYAARAIHLLALLERYKGDLEKAQQLLEQSPVFKLPGSPGRELGQYFHVKGLITAERNDLPTAERFYFRAYQFYQEVLHDAGLAEASDSLANLLLRRGNPRRAIAFARLSLTLKQKIGDRRGEAISMGTIVAVRRRTRLSVLGLGRHSFSLAGRDGRPGHRGEDRSRRHRQNGRRVDQARRGHTTTG
jgi:tetratricopeptide (TPR) repeat protein